MKSIGSVLLHKSVADVTRRKARTLGAILGILIGVFGLTSITMFQDTYFNALAYTNAEVHQSDMTFDVQSVDPALAPTLIAVSNVKAIEFQTSDLTSWHIQQAPGQIPLLIAGLPDPAHSDMNKFALLSGRYPGDGEIVLESGDRGLEPFSLGDMVTVDTPLGSQQLRVVGIARTPGIGDPANKGSALGYMSQQALFQIMGSSRPNVIQVRVKDQTQIHVTQAQLNDVLKAHGVTLVGSTLHVGVGDSQLILNNLFNILRILSVVAILVSCFLIVNTITTLLAEQIHIIGAMKAMGGVQQEVFLSYLRSVGIYMLLGTLFGLGLGTAGGYVLASKLAAVHNLDLGPFVLPLDVLGLALLAGLGVPLLAALYPLWKGTHMTVREAISAYGISSSGGPASSRLQQAIGRRLTWVPQTTWLGLRNMFRKHGRAILTILALTLSGTTFLAITNASYAIGTQVETLYESYHFDVQVNQIAGTPQDAVQFRDRLLTMPNVQSVERFGSESITTRWGNLNLSAVEEDTRMYHPSLVAGRWFTPHERQVMLLSDDGANSMGLKVGDTIIFSEEEHVATWRIIGLVHDPNVTLGSRGSAITSAENLNLLVGLEPSAGAEWNIQARNESPAAVDALATQLMTRLNRGTNTLQFTVTPAQHIIQQSQNQFSDLYSMFYIVASVIALIGALSLYTTLTSSVMERQREIGIWRAMGARGRQVAGVFWVEGMALGVIAWVTGVVISIPLAYGFLQLLGLLLLHASFTFDPRLLVIMLVVILVIALLASCGPMVRAARVRIVDLLRYE